MYNTDKSTIAAHNERLFKESFDEVKRIQDKFPEQERQIKETLARSKNLAKETQALLDDF